jgi:ATP-dependent Clp protease adaptor protein ClpS
MWERRSQRDLRAKRISANLMDDGREAGTYHKGEPIADRLMSDQATKTAPAPAKPKPVDKKKPKKLPPWNVILLNDDDHSYEYVIEMLQALFAYPPERGYQLAKEVDTEGRVILLTTHREKAELKRDQIHAYGADARVATCKGSMSAMIEPADG